MKTDSETYNLAVIGGGAAGLVASYIGATVKAKTVLVEKHKMGGDCLNTGCVPSKALIKTARFIDQARKAKALGLTKVTMEFDLDQIMNRVQRVIKAVEPHDSVARYAAMGVECLQGEASFVDDHSLRVGDRLIRSKNFIIATGAAPLIPEIPGIQETSFLTTDTVWNLTRLPKRLLVLGGGPVGCELAQCFQSLGSQVTILERSSELLPREDKEIGQHVSQKFTASGVAVMTSTELVRFEGGQEKRAIVRKHGQEISVLFDDVLLALGRKPTLGNLRGDIVGLKQDSRGFLITDQRLCAGPSHIFACGDVVGPYQLTHMASHQAWYAAVNALFRPFVRYKVDYSVVPWCTYTWPEVARVGINETEAKQKGMDVQITTYDVGDLDRAIADEEAVGLVKVITQKKTDKILGATIVASHAGDMIMEYVAAMKNGYGLNRILQTIHPYPTFSEANKMAAGLWKKQTTGPGIFKWLEWYHKLRR